MSEDDLVLCERAAKAVGVEVRRSAHNGPVELFVTEDHEGICGSEVWFRPLQDDGLTFRMLGHLMLTLFYGVGSDNLLAVHVGYLQPGTKHRRYIIRPCGDDRIAFTSLAIVEAAAESAP